MFSTKSSLKERKSHSDSAGASFPLTAFEKMRPEGDEIAALAFTRATLRADLDATGFALNAKSGLTVARQPWLLLNMELTAEARKHGHPFR